MRLGTLAILMGWLGRLWQAWQLLFGFDVFISYKWSDSACYAEALMARLQSANLMVFLDRHETPGGILARKYNRRRLFRSQSLVVIASPEAIANTCAQFGQELVRRQLVWVAPGFRIIAIHRIGSTFGASRVQDQSGRNVLRPGD